MKTGAMGMGLLGGILALCICTAGYAGGNVLKTLQIEVNLTIIVLSVLIPVTGLWGALIIRKKRKLGSILMYISAIAVFPAIGLNSISLLISIPLIVGGILGITAEDPSDDIPAKDNSTYSELNQHRIESIFIKNENSLKNSGKSMNNNGQNPELSDQPFPGTENAENIQLNELNEQEGNEIRRNISSGESQQKYDDIGLALTESSTSLKTLKLFASVLLILALLVPVILIIVMRISAEGNTSVSMEMMLSPLSLLVYSIPVLALAVLLFSFAALSRNLTEIKAALRDSLMNNRDRNNENLLKMNEYLKNLEAKDRKIDLLLQNPWPRFGTRKNYKRSAGFVRKMELNNPLPGENKLIEDEFKNSSTVPQRSASNSSETVIKTKTEALLEETPPKSTTAEWERALTEKDDLTSTIVEKKNMEILPQQNDKSGIQYIIDTGNRMFKENQYAQALEHYNQAISMNHNDFILLSKRANTYFLLKEYDNAIGDYEKALTVKINSGITYYYCGYARLMNSDKEKAKMDLLKARELGIRQAEELLDKYCK